MLSVTNIPYAVSSKEDTAYLRQLITRIRVMINSRFGVSTITYTPYAQLVMTIQTTIPNTAAFQTEDLDAYDSDCDDVSNEKAVLMANLSSYGSDVLSEANQEKNNESVTAELERYKERVKTFEQRLNVDLSTREKMIDYQIDDMIKEKLALKQQIDLLK
ncbi:hypothetical protein Tco_0667107 [Tanacetum coccineum]